MLTRNIRSNESLGRALMVRLGFTLIELLVVIAIIAILIGLTTAGVFKFLDKGPDLKDVNDIRQLETSVAAFKVKFGCYPPSKIKLCSTRGEYGVNPPPGSLEAESLSYLYRIWPRLDLSSAPIKWSGSVLPNGGITLDGDQCLVFFLGGVGGSLGFSTNQKDPSGNGLGGETSFFQFPAGRLKPRPAINPFPSYVDNWGDRPIVGEKPFVYFSSGTKKNGYNSNGTINHQIMGLDGVQPYFEVPGNFHNPTTFQIISSGKDGKFSTAGQWSAVIASSTDPTIDWKDNRTNFSGNQLAARAAD